MQDKSTLLEMLEEELNRWEELLGQLSEEQITAPVLPSGLSIKDVIAHLMAWQQVSNARMEAARLNRQPAFPAWLAGQDPESEDGVDRYNARIYETYRQQSWQRVHQSWREGFLRLLEQGEAVPENELMETSRYPWLKGYALIAVLRGTYEHHHHDHYEPLLAWLRQQGSVQTSS